MSQLNSLPNRPLHTATSNGHPHNIKTLLEAGSKLDACNFSKLPLLHSAVMSGKLKSVKMLV